MALLQTPAGVWTTHHTLFKNIKGRIYDSCCQSSLSTSHQASRCRMPPHHAACRPPITRTYGLRGPHGAPAWGRLSPRQASIGEDEERGRRSPGNDVTCLIMVRRRSCEALGSEKEITQAKGMRLTARIHPLARTQCEPCYGAVKIRHFPR